MPSASSGQIVSGRYRLLSVIGQGGMGVVYRATQLDPHGEPVRDVAVKMIRRELITDPNRDLGKRFLREIKAAAQLRGPYVVAVYDFGQSESGELYFVMPLFRGLTLREILDAQSTPPVVHILTIAMHSCEAMYEAHTLPNPIIHRDLKPSNIFVEGWPHSIRTCVGDFGIAKILGEHTSGITHSGISPGTPRYMAPEQCRGDEVDARTDLYALGVILHEALTGRPPFSGDPMAVLFQHQHKPPPRLPDSLPEPLRSLVSSLLAKDPAERPTDAHSVSRLLGTLISGSVAEGSSKASTTTRTQDERSTVAPAADRRRSGSAEHATPAVHARHLPMRAVGILALLVGLGALVRAVPSAWFDPLGRIAALRSSWRQPATMGDGEPWRAESGSGSGGDPSGSHQEASTGIAVLEFQNDRHNDREYDWMSNALQAAFSTELAKVQNVRVFSRESIERQDRPGGSAMELVRTLGANKFISGSFAVHGGQIRVDARLVDARSGMQESAEGIEGSLDEFFSLQKQLALRMLASLPVVVSARDRASIAAANRSENPERALDAYKLLLQGEGLDTPAGGSSDVNAEPHADDPMRPSSSPARSLFAGILGGVAYAAEPEDLPPSDSREQGIACQSDGPRCEVEGTLERYRQALQSGDLDAIADTRGALSERQRSGLIEYFANAENLSVHFRSVRIDEVDPHRFDVSYIRQDDFADRRTGETVSLEIHMENAVVRKGDRWVLESKRGLGTQ